MAAFRAEMGDDADQPERDNAYEQGDGERMFDLMQRDQAEDEGDRGADPQRG